MNSNDIDTLSLTNGNSSREGIDECTYNLLQTDEKSVSVEGTDFHLACPEQEVDLHLACPELEVAAVSTSMNIEGQISFPSDNLTAEDQSENCCPHGKNMMMQSVLLPIADGVLPNDDGGEEPVEEVSATTPPRDEDPPELRCLLTEPKPAITDSIVLKKLLRKSRYFDSGNSCLQDRAANLSSQKRRKLCYLCGKLHHDAKKCPKRRACYTCKTKGHFAVDCPLNITESERICLKCGEIGHEISSCNNDYCPDDLKKIQCYVCNELGHIFCGSYIDNISMPTVSCHNCGESGHLGLQCLKPLVDRCGSKPPSICYKCGEDGHVARNCIISSQASRCLEGGQGAASHLGQETDDADVQQNHKRARRSKSFRHGRARRRKLKVRLCRNQGQVAGLILHISIPRAHHVSHFVFHLLLLSTQPDILIQISNGNKRKGKHL